jgi:hypothetical protein
MEENLIDDQPAGSAKRPRFLAVLCILTWTGSLIGIALSIKTFSTLLDHAERLGFGFSFTDRYVISCAVWIAASLFCIAGAIFMWRLRIVGFETYLAGQLLEFVFNVYNSSSAESVNWLFLVGTIISLLFVVLYSFNLKHLR